MVIFNRPVQESVEILSLKQNYRSDVDRYTAVVYSILEPCSIKLGVKEVGLNCRIEMDPSQV